MTVWREARPIVLAVSIALNVALLSTWAAHAIPTRLQEEPIAQEPTQQEIWCPLHRELGVTMEQWRRIEPRLVEFHEKAQENCQRLQGLRDELLDLLAAPQQDMEAVRAKQEEILEGHRRMQELVLARLRGERKVLTAEQQAKLFAMIRRRMSCPGPGRMMGLSGRGTGERRRSREDVGRRSATPAEEQSR
ncbi:MAG: hypothetical protein R6X33_12870 [Candidatus Brocadiia bacterium]